MGGGNGSSKPKKEKKASKKSKKTAKDDNKNNNNLNDQQKQTNQQADPKPVASPLPATDIKVELPVEQPLVLNNNDNKKKNPEPTASIPQEQQTAPVQTTIPAKDAPIANNNNNNNQKKKEEKSTNAVIIQNDHGAVPDQPKSNKNPNQQPQGAEENILGQYKFYNSDEDEIEDTDVIQEQEEGIY